MKRLSFTRSHETEFPLEEPSGEAMVLLAAEAAGMLGWRIEAIAPAALLMKGDEEEIVAWIWNGEIRVRSITTDDRVHDWGRNRRNTERFREAFGQIRKAGLRGDIYERFEGLTHQYPFYGDAGLLPYGPAWFPQKQPARSYLFFSEGFVITPALVSINILIFLLMCITGADIVDPGARTIIAWGGNYGPLTLHGQWWRIITCEFLHIGIIHLLANMLALFFIGSFLEPLLGRLRFLVAYLLAAVGASLLSLYVHPDTVSAGASGAIFGLMGIFFAMLTLGVTDRRTTRALLPNFGIYILYALFSGLEEHIDNAGHLGGLIAGLIIGMAIHPGLKQHTSRLLNYLPLLLLSAGMMLLTLLVFSSLS